MSESEEALSVTREGVEHVLSWCRFQLQLCELTHTGDEWWKAYEAEDSNNEDDHEAHKVAFLVFVLCVPWAQYFGIPLEIEGEVQNGEDDHDDYEEDYEQGSLFFSEDRELRLVRFDEEVYEDEDDEEGL